MNKVILGLLATTILVACGNGGGEGGSTTNSDTSSPLSTNTYAQDKLQKKRPSLFTNYPYAGNVVYTIDPENETFTLTLPSEVNDEDANLGNGMGTVTVTGKFDPATGRLTADDCYPASFYCVNVFDGWYDKPFDSKYIQDGRVILLDKNYRFNGYGYHPSYNYFGTRPTASDKMPGGTLTYKGHVLGDYFDHGTITQLVGTSTSVVNFDTGIMNVDFTNMKGDVSGVTASVKDISIDGNTFSGGSGSITTPAGKTLVDKKVGTAGMFFGKNAQDLGGEFNLDITNQFDFVYFRGVWSGEQQ